MCHGVIKVKDRTELRSHLMDKGAVRRMYVGRTWNEATKIGTMYNILYTVRHCLLDEDMAVRNRIAEQSSTLIVDFCESLTEAEKRRVLTLYPYHKTIFFEADAL